MPVCWKQVKDMQWREGMWGHAGHMTAVATEGRERRWGPVNHMMAVANTLTTKAPPSPHMSASTLVILFIYILLRFCNKLCALSCVADPRTKYCPHCFRHAEWLFPGNRTEVPLSVCNYLSHSSP